MQHSPCSSQMHVLQILVDLMEHVHAQAVALVDSWIHIVVPVAQDIMEQTVNLLIIQQMNVSLSPVFMAVFVLARHRHRVAHLIRLLALVKVRDFRETSVNSLMQTVLRQDTVSMVELVTRRLQVENVRVILVTREHSVISILLHVRKNCGIFTRKVVVLFSIFLRHSPLHQ